MEQSGERQEKPEISQALDPDQDGYDD
jgi:hypothetical protein